MDDSMDRMNGNNNSMNGYNNGYQNIITPPKPGSNWSWQLSHEGLYTLNLAWAEYGVTAAFSSRSGGCSTGPYAKLNMGLHVGDSPQDVLENRRRFLGTQSGSLEQCVVAEQIHQTKIAQVDDTQGGAGMLDLVSALPGYDALSTQSSVGLMAFFADCVPLFFFDPETRWVALAHAGWRGSAAGMARTMVEFLCERGCQATNILAAIGPSVGSCCYEVDEATANIFLTNVQGFGAYALPRGNGKFALDLAKVNQLELIQAGLQDSHISVASLCTCCHSDWFYSYRQNNRTGRMAAYIRRNQ